MTDYISEVKGFSKKETLKAKGIAICLLLFHHLFYSPARLAAGKIEFRWVPQNIVVASATCARVCVWIFAFLSAYGLSAQYYKLGNNVNATQRGEFVKKHWISLMKPYWFIYSTILLLSLFLFKRPWAVYQNNPVYFLLDALGWADFFGTPSMMNVWWYMCFAQIVVLGIPAVCELTKKFGWITVPFSFVLIQFLDLNAGIQSNFGGAYINYLFVVLLGSLFAHEGIMEKLSHRNNQPLLKFLTFLGLIVGIIVCVYINYRYAEIDRWKFAKVFMSCSAIMIVLLVYKYCTWKWLERILTFLGKYSGTMFLIHGFGYAYYLKQIYWSHNVILTWLTLLIISLGISYLLEKLKWLLAKIPFMKGLL